MAQSSKKTTAKSRKRKPAVYKHFRLSKKIKHHTALPSGVKILRESTKIFWQNKRIFGGIVAVSAFFQYVIVQSLGSPLNIIAVKEQVQGILGDGASKFTTGWVVFGSVVGSAGRQSSDVAGVYQSIILLVTALASIWAIRQLMAGESVRLKETFYNCMYPVIPFVLVAFVISLQLIPAGIGSFLYSTVIGNGLAVTAIEKALWLMIFILLATLSLYMVLSSVFALYIVTLPEMTPLKALRSARNLVLHRRLSVVLRFLVVMIVIGALSVILLLPLIIFLPGFAEIMVYIFSATCIVFLNIFTYKLYRELLK